MSMVAVLECELAELESKAQEKRHQLIEALRDAKTTFNVAGVAQKSGVVATAIASREITGRDNVADYGNGEVSKCIAPCSCRLSGPSMFIWTTRELPCEAEPDYSGTVNRYPYLTAQALSPTFNTLNSALPVASSAREDD